MSSALEHLEVVEQYLREEGRTGCILGPFNQGEIPDLHISRISVILKGQNSVKWRLITDLTFLVGTSVNTAISLAHCTLQYTSVDNIARAAHRLGPCALHPDDHKLLGVAWNGVHLCATIWTTVGTKGVHCSGRRFGVVHSLTGSHWH